MTEVVTSIDIAAPPEKVWALAMDPDCLAEWVTIHRRLHSHDDGPPRKGYAMEQTLHLRGVNFKVHWELVACDECRPRRVARPRARRARTPRPSTASRPVDGGTRFDYRNEFKAPLGPLGPVASRALVGGLPRREADASLRRLKALVERG